MFKYIPSQKGGTLMLVFGFIVVLALVVAPLALNTNIGLLGARTSGTTEVAFTEAHSAMTVFARMYQEMVAADETNNTEANIEALVDTVAGMNALGAQVTLLRDSDRKPTAVRFTSQAGSGNQVRTSKVLYQLAGLYDGPGVDPNPTPTPTPTPGPTPTPTTTPPPITADGMKVLMKNDTTPQNNKLFAACYLQPATGQQLPFEHILNNFTRTQFLNWFENAADQYLAQASETIGRAFQNVFADGRLALAAALNSKVSGSDLLVEQSNGPIQHGNTVNIANRYGSNLTGSIVIGPSDSGGNAVRTTGDFNFGRINAEILIDGNTQAGGSLNFIEVKDSKTITFNGDVTVKGNVNFGTGGTVNEIIVEGDLVIGGNLNVGNTLTKLIVKGDLVVGGNVTINYPVLVWQVNGSFIVNGDFNATNTVHRFDVRRDAAVKGRMVFLNPLAQQSQGIQGLFSVGGTFKVQGPLDIKNTVRGFNVAGDVIVNNDLTFHNHVASNFVVNGSILVSGSLRFKNSVDDFNVMRNVVAGGMIAYENTIGRTFNVGGSFVAAGDITFQNTIASSVTLSIKENLITKSNLKFNDWTLNGSLDIGGYLLVFKDATLHALGKGWNANRMKGFYVGGTTNFYADYAKDWFLKNLDNGQEPRRICIT